MSVVSGCKPWVDEWPGKDKVCGKSWEELSGWIAACPKEWPFGTRIKLLNTEWLCADRGGAIRYENGIPWIDMLIEKPRYPYGTIVEVKLINY